MGNCLSGEQSIEGGKHAQGLAAIRDRFESIEEVKQALNEAGVEACEVCSLFQICYRALAALSLRLSLLHCTEWRTVFVTA